MNGPGGPADPNAARGSRSCPSCGWANAPSATSCEFCRLPFEKAAPRPRQPVSVVCPHCEREALRNPGDHVCPDCGQDDRTQTNVVRKGVGAIAPAVRSFRPSREVVIGLAIVAPTLLGALFFLRAHGKAVTADHIRHIKKMVEIYGGKNDAGEVLYDSCELRSAGRNGTFGDDDDVVWAGPSQR
jgi:hypothetical protein